MAFRPGSQVLVPSGAGARVAANLAAIELSAALEEQGRAASASEQAVLAGWSGWGAVPGVFDPTRAEFAAARERLRGLLTEQQWQAARRTTLNAHYTDPAYAAAIWRAVQDLGFTGGRVLEPGCGSGTFLGLAPPGAQLTGVELDPITARIAAQLYPHAQVRTESFADSPLVDGSFHAVVGNVPFANVRLHDARHNRGRHALHNHFIIKSLALTRPGGMVAVLSSAFTLDAQNPAARREMHALADLVGAIRLPSGAHRRAAGTEVVTDLLILRRRPPDQPPRQADPPWLRTTWHPVGDVTARINAYFQDHPERVLGELEIGHGMHGSDTLLVRTDDLPSTAQHLTTALRQVVTRAQATGLLLTAAEPAPPVAPAPVAGQVPGERPWAGHITAHPDGTFTVLGLHGHDQPLEVPRTQRAELTALLGLRDAARQLLTAEAASAADTEHIDRLRADLARGYADYAQRFGPINRFTVSVSATRTDPGTRQPVVTRRVPPVMRLLRGDPFGPLVKALEVFDDTTGTASPAALLTRRVVAPRAVVLGADTAADALAVTLEATGRVDLTQIARLRGLTHSQARTDLGQLVFDDPQTGQLVPAAEYLSGDVRSKLAAAQQAAADTPELAGNVEALRAVQPADLGPGEIEPRIGAAWISAADHQQFLAELLGDTRVRVQHPGGTVWAVRASRTSLAATSQWGTQRRPAGDLLEALLEQRPIQVHDTDPEGRRVLNAVETEAARDKAAAIADRFADWVWEDPERATRLAGEYNRRFNCLTLRDYTVEGARLTLPGLASTFTPRPHQRAAVARIISEPAVGLFHQVGAGKTAEMVMGAMELRRLGMASKPAVVVPNHMLEQFTREWLQLYPQAKILAAGTEDLTGPRRREFVARAAANDWDAVVMTRSAFERIPVSTAARADYLQQQVDDQRAILEHARQTDAGLTVKRLEKAVLRVEETLKAVLDGPVDAGITWEQTGLDYLLIDEGHDYKNLTTVSNIADAAIEGSKRAADLHMKTELLRATHGHRVITMATATPIANSITEAHVMARYLRPDLLQQAGVGEFDAWAATFGQTVTEMELAPAGGGFRQKTRFAKFSNVPEMLRLWAVFADVKTAADLNLPTPELAPRADGQRRPETVLIPPSDALASYVTELGRRAEQVAGRGVDPATDNMLKISTDGRKAALDLRLVTPGSTGDGPNKIAVAADRIAGIHHTTKTTRYLDPGTGQPHPVPGGLQIVFCDLSTPTGTGWNAYTELREQLTARGIPAEQIRFIHDAKTDTDKARLFSAARNGHIAVLVGSTQKMGVGTNVQARAVALHHLDCPWRPADLEQRDGRILRQGNQNPQVQIIRYVVQQSFDAYSWQTVERKARFIHQVMRGRIDIREIEDIGDTTLSYAEAKALASGDPLILDKATADTELARLQRLERAWRRNQTTLTQRAEQAQRVITRCTTDLPAARLAAARTRTTRGEHFHAAIAGQPAADRTQAAELLHRWAAEHLSRHPLTGQRPRSHGVIAELGGHQITATEHPGLGRTDIHLDLHQVPRSAWSVGYEALTASAAGVLRQMENRVAAVTDLPDRIRAEQSAAEHEAAQARAALQEPFKHAADLTAARHTLDRINQALTARQNPPSTADAPGAPALPEQLSRLRGTVNHITTTVRAIATDQGRDRSDITTEPGRTALPIGPRLAP